MNIFITRIAGFLGSNLVHYIYNKVRLQEVKFTTCSSNKSRKLLIYKTKFSLDKSIELTCEYIKRRGPKPFEYHINLEIKNKLTPQTWLDKEL